MEYTIEPGTEGYYTRKTLKSAVAQAKEMIEEWDYVYAPHGYCHERPMLIRLVEAIEGPLNPNPTTQKEQDLKLLALAAHAYISFRDEVPWDHDTIDIDELTEALIRLVGDDVDSIYAFGGH